MQAVDSEHGKNLAVDAWRLHQLCKATANQEHPWARFFTGGWVDASQSFGVGWSVLLAS